MSVSFVNNAIYTKARAMHGKLLKEENYEQLLNSRSVNEVAVYLKTKTAYAGSFENFSGLDMRRKKLESAIRKGMLDNCAALANYELLMGMDFYKYFIVKDEVFMIMKCIGGFNGDVDSTVSKFTQKHSELDFEKLSATKNFDELLSALDTTVYYGLLKPLQKQDENILSLTAETVLMNYLNSTLFCLSCSCFKGNERKEILDYLKAQADVKRVISAYRICKSFSWDRIILSHLFSDKLTAFSESEIKNFIRANSAEGVLKALQSTVYAKDFSKYNCDLTEKSAEKYLYNLSKKLLTFSQSKTLVMLCYVYLAEAEVKKITELAEGIRYNLPVDEIRALIN